MAGTSEYSINGKTVTYKKYSDKLESFNILVKAKNFLIQQVRALFPNGLTSLLSRSS